MTRRDDLARSAVTAALRLRNQHRLPLDTPICPIDLALAVGVDVRFEALPSLEGMYSPDGPAVILGALRPRGRRSYTCAHELGHHVFGHGLRIDELLDDDAPREKDEAEYVADRFAAALLMPKFAVARAFTDRGWNVATCSPEQIFTIAGLFGVGYTTLIGTLQGTLGMLPPSAAQALRKATPKKIRARAVGTQATGLVIVDEHWSARPVDAEVGDTILVPPDTTADNGVLERTEDGVLMARAPGITTITSGTSITEVRVARAAYTGLALYRHLGEPDDDEV